MTEILESHPCGRWVAGAGEGALVRDAVTGEPVARVSSDGLDLAAAVAYARDTGGAALRGLTFHQRAAALTTAASALDARNEELYALSARAGATRRDAPVDVDGGIATAFVYAGMARRGLPDGTVVLEDDPVPLGKGGTFAGRHVLTTPHGIALQINAFNFPVWALLEKLAPALIAGVPTIVKPATPTAYIAVHAVRILVLDRDSTTESTGHGTPMPQLIHGGPGRAGGGEEEGGLRAVRAHLRRSAVQGTPAVLEQILR